MGIKGKGKKKKKKKGFIKRKEESEYVQYLCMFLLWQDVCVLLLHRWFSRD